MSFLGGTGEGLGEGVKKAGKWWVIGLIATVALATVATGGIAGVIFGLTMGAHVGLIAGLAGAAAGFLIGGIFSFWGGAGAGAAVAGAGLIKGGTEGVGNHIKRGQAGLDQTQQMLIDDNARLSAELSAQQAQMNKKLAQQYGTADNLPATLSAQEAQMTKNLAEQYGTMANPYTAAGAQPGYADREIERRQAAAQLPSLGAAK